MTLKLVLANKAYSSWSFRAWILLRHFGIPFEEEVIPLDRPETHEAILAHAPSGKCPSLRDGSILVWDSLAIVEYVAESFPEVPVWPLAKPARALARSLACEMHSSFQSLRAQCPMNFRRPQKPIELSAATLADVNRIEAAWADARRRFGADGPYLFGQFSAADAMFAPVVNRLHIYAVEVAPATQAYMETIMSLPAWRQWHADAAAEPWLIDTYEAI